MTPQDKARQALQHIIWKAVDKAQYPPGKGGSMQIVEDALSEMLSLELLITDGKARPVIETDWRDRDGEYETWTVYTEPDGDGGDE